jgi:predicted acylesterase/phospholipase RssA
VSPFGPGADDAPGTHDIDRHPPSTQRVAFAIGGGGSRGSFGVGALNYLTIVVGIGASVVTGTSVGALLALKVAEFAPAQQASAAAALAAEWTDLTHESDMWEWEPWIASLEDESLLGTTVGDFVEDFLGVHRSRDPYALSPATGYTDLEIQGAAALVLGPAVLPATLVGLATLAPPAIAILYQKVSALQTAFDTGQVMSFTNLLPTELRARSAADLAMVRAHEDDGTVQLRLATVCLETGRLRYVTGNGSLLERDNVTPVQMTSMRQEDPACVALAQEVARLATGTIDFDSEGKPHRTLEDVLDQLRDKRRELDSCRRQHPPTITSRPAQVDVLEGTMASAAAPAFFPPRKLLGDTYIDGGLREQIPVDVALRCGADLVYAISEGAIESTPSDQIVPGPSPRETTTSYSNLINIATRALAEITLDEITFDDISRFGDSVSVIAPSFNVHSGLVIDPGLIDIWMDYGFMRASDVAKYPAGIEDRRLLKGSRAVELSDHLTRLRVAVWMAEHVLADAAIVQLAIGHGPPGFLPRWQANGPSLPQDPNHALAWVRFLRVLENAIVKRRESLGLYSGRVPGQYLLSWERHPFGVPGTLWPNPATQLRPLQDPPARRLLTDMTTGKIFQLTAAGAVVELSSVSSASPPGTTDEVSGLPPGLVDILRTV